MYPLIRYGVRPGIGDITLLTGVHGHRFSGTNTTATSITGIIITVRITVIHLFTASPTGVTGIMAAGSGPDLFL
jgi:hypothetical protein